jgi:signal transduction histidine kinase/ActR/RegA family two-component response regulator
VAVICIAYAVIALALVPFASRPWLAVPQVTGVYATTVFITDICTFVLLAAQFRASGARWLIVLSCAYLYSALMALLHFLTFPGAIVPDGPVLGEAQTVGWLYLLWSLGFVGLLFAAVLVAPRTPATRLDAEGADRALGAAIAAVLGAALLLALVTTVGAHLLPPLTFGDRFAVAGITMNGVRALLALLALIVLWATGRGSTVVLLWLSLTLVAAAAGPLLTELGGRRYTFGWYAGRASFAVASCVILVVLIAKFVRLQIALARALDRVRSQAEALAAEIARRESAEAASRGKDDFLAMLGHELRNPLAAIRTAVSVLDTAGDRGDVAARARNVIARQSDHLKRLIDDLLDVGRAISGKIALLPEPLDLADAVNRAAATIFDGAGSSRHAVTMRTTPVWIMGDVTRIEQLVTNLVGNAVAYTPPGGRIDIDVVAVEDEAVLVVADSGIGIPADMQARIFDLFVQGPQSPDRPLGGLGIGLTLARRLVEAHRGTISVMSEGHGRGSVFTVRLPRIAPPVGSVDEDGRVPATRVGRASPRRVLVVEDNDDGREMLCVRLRRAGHHVDEAADGPAALETAAAHPPDVAVIDIGLPGMDGYEVGRRLRARKQGDLVKLIALTGYGLPANRDRAMSAGFDIHLTKPCDVDKLVALIEDGRRTPAISS